MRQADYTEVEVVFAPGQAASAQEYQDYKYGDNLFTIKQSEEALRDIGIWVFYGEKANYQDFLAELRQQNFSIEALPQLNLVTALWQNPKFAVPPLVSLLGVMLCATVVYSKQMQVVSCREILGVNKIKSIAKDVGGNAFAALVLACLATGAYVLVNVICNGYDRSAYVWKQYLDLSLFSLVFYLLIVATMIVSQMIVWSSRYSLVERLKDRRPYRALRNIALVTFVFAGILATHTSLVTAQHIAAQSTILRAQKIWDGKQNINSLFVPYLNETQLTEQLQNIKNLVVNATKYDIGVLYSQPDAECEQIVPGLNCIWVAGEYAQLASQPHLATTTSGEVKVYVPQMFASHSAQIHDYVSRRLQFEAEFIALEGSATVAPPTITLSPQETGEVPIFHTTLVGAYSFENPVIVAADTNYFSGDSLLSAVTTGNLLFIGDAEKLQQAINESGLQEMELRVTSPQVEAQGAALATEQEITRGYQQMVMLTLVSILAVVCYSVCYVLQNRKIITLRHLLGYRTVENLAVLFGVLAVAAAFVIVAAKTLAGGSTPHEYLLLTGMFAGFAGIGAFAAVAYEKATRQIVYDLRK
ncbi:hypothetical protein [Canibacter oris]|uniref:Uncharacterized protein n=1 Tax=Canibacter oris TaxID=1365628 RepID=A0A840DCX5_9MICO|nr:hypothetical protein [Canibacter oris]MBB4071311.1 hypothetical protein [Canibacter oris]